MADHFLSDLNFNYQRLMSLGQAKATNHNIWSYSSPCEICRFIWQYLCIPRAGGSTGLKCLFRLWNLGIQSWNAQGWKVLSLNVQSWNFKSCFFQVWSWIYPFTNGVWACPQLPPEAPMVLTILYYTYDIHILYIYHTILYYTYDGNGVDMPLSKGAAAIFVRQHISFLFAQCIYLSFAPHNIIGKTHISMAFSSVHKYYWNTIEYWT